MAKITKKGFTEAAKNSAGNQSVIAKSLKVSRSAVTQFIQRNEWAKELMQEEDERIIDLAENKLMKALEAGDRWAVEKVLASKGARRGWADTTNQNVNNSFGDKLEIEIIKVQKKEDE